MMCRMTWVIVGLGNPGEEYDSTRHNTGRMALEVFARAAGFGDWKEDKKAKAHIASGLLGKTATVLVAPDTFMNKSGNAVAKFVKSQKAAERMVVVYDDLDLPLGHMKLSFDRGSGGHRGVESVTKAVKTKKFTRIRIGISPTTASGALRKPHGDKVVNDFILAKYKTAEREELKQIFKKVSQALEKIVADGPLNAMNEFN